MKTGLITATAIASVMVLSATAFAGGENCASKSGAHKDMSAAATKDGKDHHGWIVSKGGVATEQSAVTDAQAEQEVPMQPAKPALNI